MGSEAHRFCEVDSMVTMVLNVSTKRECSRSYNIVLGLSTPNPDLPFCPGLQKVGKKSPRPNAGKRPINNQERPPGKLTTQSLRSNSSGLKSFLIVNVPAKWARRSKIRIFLIIVYCFVYQIV